MIAFFPGKFMPPHLGHVTTIMSLYEKYDTIIIAITDESDVIISQEERSLIFQSVFNVLPKIEIITLQGMLVEYKDPKKLPFFDVCISGNEKVIEKMKEFNRKVIKAPRSKGLGFSGTEIRSLLNKSI